MWHVSKARLEGGGVEGGSRRRCGGRRCVLLCRVSVSPPGSVSQLQSQTQDQLHSCSSWRNSVRWSSAGRKTLRSLIKNQKLPWSSAERRCCCCCSAAAAAPAPAGEVGLSPGWERVGAGGRERESGWPRRRVPVQLYSVLRFESKNKKQKQTNKNKQNSFVVTGRSKY